MIFTLKIGTCVHITKSIVGTLKGKVWRWILYYPIGQEACCDHLPYLTLPRITITFHLLLLELPFRLSHRTLTVSFFHYAVGYGVLLWIDFIFWMQSALISGLFWLQGMETKDWIESSEREQCGLNVRRLVSETTHNIKGYERTYSSYFCMTSWRSFGARV